MRHLFAAAVALAFVSSAACAQPAPVTVPKAPDYAQPATWVCRPGAEEACTKDLDAMRVDAKGQRTPEPTFKVAEDAPIDCFYVYPTVSKEAGRFADLKIDSDVLRAVHGQAGRFASKCRLYAPVYRQLTLTALFAPRQPGEKLSFDPPYEDVRAAWRHYLAHDNHGRGVVLIGHSQGTILLQRLIAEEIDGKPDQRLLVSALLGGDPGFGTPPGKDVGGTFRAIPLCRALGQTGCVMVWSTYAADDKNSPLIFGRNPKPGLVAACTNPAALSGGRAMLRPYFHKPAGAPETDPPYVASAGQYSAECVSDAGGATLRVSVEPTGVYATFLKSMLDKTQTLPGWGLHILDYSLPEGDLVDDVGAQADAWAKTHPH